MVVLQLLHEPRTFVAWSKSRPRRLLFDGHGVQGSIGGFNHVTLQMSIWRKRVYNFHQNYGRCYMSNVIDCLDTQINIYELIRKI